MASVKIVLRKQPNKDNTFPLAIRITKDRKSSFIHTGKSVKIEDWDTEKLRVKKSHPNSTRLNNFLSKKWVEANDKLLELETQKSTISAQVVKKKLTPVKGASYFAQSDIFLSNLKKTGKYNRYSSDKARINRFKEFLNGEDIALSEITVSMLKRYKAYLLGTRTIKERTAINHLSIIRSIFSQAIAASVVDEKYSPFGKDKIAIKYPDSNKIGLSLEDVKRIEGLKLELGSDTLHSRNVWLFSFYFAGMRISDVLRTRWEDVQDNRLHYTMGKNEKGGSLKVPEKVLKIMEYYAPLKTSSNDFIFPELKGMENSKDKFALQRKIANSNIKINAGLKEVARLADIHIPLSMHIARHTFGNISGDKIPIQMLQKLYRHSSITTTIGYQSNFIHKDADEALDAVIGG